MFKAHFQLPLITIAASILSFGCSSALQDKDENEVNACSYTIDGQNKSGSSFFQCEGLKKEYESSQADAFSKGTQSVDSESGDKQNNKTAISCSYDLNGKSVSGSTKEECDRLLADSGLAKKSSEIEVPNVNKPESYSCSFSIDGSSVSGSSKEECDRLEQEYLSEISNLPAFDGGSDADMPLVSCNFTINGSSVSGSSKEECDKLEQEYLSQISHLPGFDGGSDYNLPLQSHVRPVRCVYSLFCHKSDETAQILPVARLELYSLYAKPQGLNVKKEMIITAQI